MGSGEQCRKKWLKEERHGPSVWKGQDTSRMLDR